MGKVTSGLVFVAWADAFSKDFWGEKRRREKCWQQKVAVAALEKIIFADFKLVTGGSLITCNVSQ